MFIFNKSKPCLTSYTEIKLRQIELSIFFLKNEEKKKERRKKWKKP